jgi:hypothetical protein
MITEQQKQIYNLYLRAFRVNNNSPFRAKKNFDDVESDGEKMISLQKIERVFQKYPAFFSKMFFDAPYKVYDDDKKFFSLKFYSSHKGISTCIAYYKVLLQGNPEEQFDFLKDSYKFVAKFCEERKINLNQYTKFCSVAQNDCLIHLKEHKISWFLVFNVPGFYNLLYNLPRDEFELYYGSSIDLYALYDRYNSSAKTRDFLDKIKGKIAQYLQKKVAETKKV